MKIPPLLTTKETSMRVSPRSETEAQRVSRRRLLTSGWYDGRIAEAVEKPSKRGNDMIEVMVAVPDAEGNERQILDWLTNGALGAAKLRHAAEAVGAITRYASGEISQADFPGHNVRVKIAIEKRRGYPDANRIEDYAAATEGHAP
jgi:hypothetical protein